MKTGIRHDRPGDIRAGLVPVGITETEINTKQDLSAWVRAHASAPGINWTVVPGPGGTMIIREFDRVRVAQSQPAPAYPVPVPAAL